MQQKILQLALEILKDNASKEQPIDHCGIFKIGEQYFIRTVTYHAVGVCIDITDGFVVLSNAMWVADSGRLSNALNEGIEKQSQSELEPYPGNLNININSIVDFTIYSPKIILLQK